MQNALLLFLSEIHLKDGRLICTSYRTEDVGTVEVYQTNEAAVQFLMRKLGNSGATIDHIFAFSTQKTQESISWVREDGSTVIEIQRDIFKANILRSFPMLEDKITFVDFDEKCSSDKIVSYVLKMADTIRMVMGDNLNDWYVHTDLTGGMRHATVMMMSVLHLLKYRGIQIGQAVYANFRGNRIEDVSGIHRMFELVSSADSFLNYANLKEIDDYFKQVPENNKSIQLTRLLDALRTFSDAVRVCRTGKFEPSLKELSISLQQFKSYESKSPQEGLFAQILKALEEDYKNILEENISRTAIIRWCIDKKYLQQAMTLFNEWMPAEVVRNKLYHPMAKYSRDIQAKCKKMNQGYKQFENVFVHDYYGTPKSLGDTQSEGEKEIRVTVSKKFLSDFRSYMKNHGSGYMPENIDKDILLKLVRNIKSIDNLKRKVMLNQLKWIKIEQDYPELYKCILGRRSKDTSYSAKPIKNVFLSKLISTDAMFKWLQVAPDDFLYDLLEIKKGQEVDEIDTVEQIQEDRNTAESIALRWEYRKQEIINMLHSGIAGTQVAEEDLLQIVEKMHWIRNQRNQINHAYGGADVVSSDEIEACMIFAMEKMNMLINNDAAKC